MSPAPSDRADPPRAPTSRASGQASGYALRARAPGKLMLAGEYSVLRAGGLAIAVAVPYGVEIVAVPASRWEIHRDDAASWREGDPSVPEELRFVHAALEHSLRVFPSLAPQRLSARTLGDVGQGATKPGVGGSASATVATSALLNDATSDPGERLDDTALLAQVIAAHRAGQDGQGSGYDVATILRGGLVAFRRQRAAPPRAETHLWPKDFHILAGYSGRSASTTRQLQKVRHLAEIDADDLARELEIVGAPVPSLLTALDASDVVATRNACAACHAAVTAWDSAHDLGIVTPAIEQLLEKASDFSVAAKIAGAGAGDSAVAISDDPDRLDHLAGAWRALGFSCFPMPVDPRGVQVDSF